MRGRTTAMVGNGASFWRNALTQTKRKVQHLHRYIFVVRLRCAQDSTNSITGVFHVPHDEH